MKGLIIQKPWIDLILSGEKSWEMRPRSWSHRGPLALIEKGSGKVVGVATVTDCRAPLSQAKMRQYYTKHRIPEAIYAHPGFKWFTPLVLADVRRLDPPVPYKHKNGAQNPVNLDPDAETAVLRQMGEGRGHSVSPATTRLASHVSEESAAARTLRPAPSVSRGDTLVIDLVIKDSSYAVPSAKLPSWVELIGMWAVVVFLFCQLAFIIHLVLGMSSNSISALAAFKWLIPLFIAAVIAGLCGQGEFLEIMAPEPRRRPGRRRRR